MNFALNIIIREIAQDYGYTICDLFSGHGIGELLHMPPLVHHVGNTLIKFVLNK